MQSTSLSENRQQVADESMLSGPEIVADSIGIKKADISVEISTRFLEHFSEQLYSSPQKAFEELIANGWDACAEFVDIRIPDDLTSDQATITVLDNGISMNEGGLRELWHIAFSPKTSCRMQYGRQMVGKFGIGKLATYVLANRLTYICKAEDQVIRRVTMDYGEIDRKAEPDKLISELTLDMFEVTDTELTGALQGVVDGTETLRIISGDSKVPANDDEIDNDFGAERSTLLRKESNTWTLVILSGLKPSGRSLKIGILKRMLRAALPLSSKMVIRINGESLVSTKSDIDLLREWKIGSDLKFNQITLDYGEQDRYQLDQESSSLSEKVKISYGNDPEPHAELPVVGKVTGMIKLYNDRISGGKSEERGVSNGFFVNVLGRIINLNDLSFGEKNLNHAAWSRFRMTVRADGLDQYLTTNREQFREHRALRIFRAFLRQAFNLARGAYDSDQNLEMPDGGDVLVKSMGVISLAPLRSVVSETLETQAPLPGLFDESGISDRETKKRDWRENTGQNIRNALSSVKFERIDDNEFVKFRISDNTIIINDNHPFVIEHTRTKAEKELMRTIAIVYLLSDIYGLEMGIEPEKLDGVRGFRNRLMQFRALARRQSGAHITKILLDVQHNSNESEQLEEIVGNALEYLGFHVRKMGKPGEPEGLAKAYSISRSWEATSEKPEQPTYSLTYDAKSTRHSRAKTGNLSLDGIEEHRAKFDADYALVVAPGFQGGAADNRTKGTKTTLMTAHDLGRLLQLTVEFGAIGLDKLEEVFNLDGEMDVPEWIDQLKEKLTRTRKFTLDKFLQSLSLLEGKVPDLLHPQTIQFTCRNELGLPTIKESEIETMVRGLAIAVPDLIGFDESTKKIIVNASADRVAEAVRVQLEYFHHENEPE